MAKDLGDSLITGNMEKFELSRFLWVAGGIVLFRTGSRLLFFYPARIQQKLLRVECFKQLEQTIPARYNAFSIGQIYQILFNDLGQLRGLVGFGLLQIGNVLIASLVLIPKLVEFESKFLLAFIPMLATVIAFSFIVYRFQDSFREASLLQGETQNQIMESYTGKQTLKNFQAEKVFFDEFTKKSSLELASFYRAGMGPAIAAPLVKLGFGMTLIWGGYLTHQLGLSSSSFILFSGFAFLFLEPLMFMSWIGTLTIRSLASWSRIQSLLEATRTHQSGEKGAKLEFGLEILSAEVEFWQHNFQIELRPGKNVFFGKTGDGKSYLLEQIALGLQAHNKSYHLVNQTPYLFNDTIQNNIIFDSNPSAETIIRARRLLEIFKLDELGLGGDILQIELGENGKQVSGGQAKRLALVRSLLDPSDYLIWDDPFSSVDVILEREILEKLNLNDYLKGKTLILTSHRLSTIKFCEHYQFIDKSRPSISGGVINESLTENNEIGEFFEKQIL